MGKRRPPENPDDEDLTSLGSDGERPQLVKQPETQTTKQKIDKAQATLSKRADYRKEAILGAVDGRRRILTTDASPWARIGCVVSVFPVRDQILVGTAWLVARDLMLTAAHNVYDNGYGGQAKKVRVSIGQNGEAAPGDVCEAEVAWVHGLWPFTHNLDNDFAILRLPRPVGETRGWFAVRSAKPETLPKRQMFVSGYPYETDKYGEQWEGRDVIKNANQNRVYYGADTTNGQSGSPIWIEDKGPDGALTRVAVGIHTNGAKGVGGGHARVCNYGPRIRAPIIRQILDMRSK